MVIHSPNNEHNYEFFIDIKSPKKKNHPKEKRACWKDVCVQIVAAALFTANEDLFNR